MDSDNDSVLSEPTSELWRDLQRFAQTEVSTTAEAVDNDDEVDDQGFSTAQLAAAMRASEQQQNHCGGESSTGPSKSSAQFSSSASLLESGRKRKRGQTNAEARKKSRSLSPIDDHQKVVKSGEATEAATLENQHPDSPTPADGENITSAANTDKAADIHLPDAAHVSSSATDGLEVPTPTAKEETTVGPNIDSSKDADSSTAHPETPTAQDAETMNMDSTHTPLTNGYEAGELIVTTQSTKSGRSKGLSKPASEKKPTKSAAARRKDRLWEVDTVVCDSNSPLVNIDLYALLMKDEAWTSLQKDQQRTLIAMLPNAPVVEEDEDGNLPNVVKARVERSDAFKADIRMFKEDLEAGRLEPEWQLMARRAVQRRANGDFDEYERQKRQETWGEKPSEEDEEEEPVKVKPRKRTKQH